MPYPRTVRYHRCLQTGAEGRATTLVTYGFTVNVAVFVVPLYMADIVTGVGADTADVVIVKYGEEVAPVAIVTLGGTPTPESLLVRFTMTPPDGAGPFRDTLFKVVEAPPFTVVGDSVTDNNTTGFTVSVAVFVMPLYMADIVTGFVAATADVVIV